MEYKNRDSLPTGIHTRINDKMRISSAWRTFGNENFESRAWETFLWDGENIMEMFDTLRSAELVIELHTEIVERFKPKATGTTASPSEAEAE